MPKVSAREEILDACLQLFVRYGYGAVTLTSVAKEAGTTKQRVRYYFSDPKNAIIELAKLWGDTGRQVTLEYLAEVHVGGVPKIQAMSKAMFEWMRRYPALSRLTPILFQTAPHIKELRDLQHQTLHRGLSRIAEILASDTKWAKKRAAERLEIARSAHAIMIGGALYVIALDQYRDMKTYEDACRQALERLLSLK